MTRILLAVLLATLAAACTGPGSTDAESANSDKDAEAFKAEMDAEAKALLPDLLASLGGDLNGMQAGFYERSGFDVWDYTASGTVFGLPGTADEALAAGAASLEEHAFTVERDAERKSIRASKGGIAVTLRSASPDDDGGVASLNLTMGSGEAISDGDDFADDAPAEDYLAYLE